MSDSQVPILPTNEENDEERLEKIAGDYTRPFSPPDDTKETVKDDTHQAYDEGKSNAAEVNDPGDRGVRGYRPKNYNPPKHGPVIVRKSHKEEKS
jgi:hypothetical protein